MSWIPGTLPGPSRRTAQLNARQEHIFSTRRALSAGHCLSRQPGITTQACTFESKQVRGCLLQSVGRRVRFEFHQDYVLHGHFPPRIRRSLASLLFCPRARNETRLENLGTEDPGSSSCIQSRDARRCILGGGGVPFRPNQRIRRTGHPCSCTIICARVWWSALIR